jgi:5-enolpyruvylshikimate-3-phosphate synthase
VLQDSDDIRYMVAALKQLGLTLSEDWANKQLTVTGCAGAFPVSGVTLELGNAGTAMRPLVAAVAAAGRGEYVLDGVARMRERPIQDLVDGLVQLGAHSCPSDVAYHSSGILLATSSLQYFQDVAFVSPRAQLFQDT